MTTPTITQLTHQPRPTGPIVCAEWCKDFDGHPDATFAADQICMSPEVTVALSLHPLVQMYDGTSVAETVLALLHRHPHTAAHIVMELSSGSGEEIRLTPTEARALICALEAAITEEGMA